MVCLVNAGVQAGFFVGAHQRTGVFKVIKTVVIAAGLVLASAGAASAQDASRGGPAPVYHGCDEHEHGPGDPCVCEREVTFYNPGRPWNISVSGGPGIRIYSRPVYVPSGRIDIQGPPIWVEAPPITVAPAQIYLHAPDVHVRPSDVTVAPPEVHYLGCDGSTTCEASSGGGGRPR